MGAEAAANLSLDQESILEDARKRTGFSDFGPLWFLEPMAKQLDSIKKEAKLSPAGIANQRGRMVNGLSSRLQMFEDIKRHPEILDEKIDVAAAICGLPRTGSTVFHRMINNAPGITAVKWWETQFFAPFPGEERGKPAERRMAAKKYLDAYMAAEQGGAIHPYQLDAPDEEIIILDQFFVGTMPESAMYVPSYAYWLDTFDQRPAYEDLVLVLKYLAWQDVSRQGKRWILKTPGHLFALEALFHAFPDTVVIMTHRDPLQTVPSYCSMVASLFHMSTDQIDSVTAGQFTEKRWAGALQRFTDLRSHMDPKRFIDVRYEDVVRTPLEQARRVLGQIGIEVNEAVETAMTEWLEENSREKRAAHHYTMEEFGLTEEMLKQDFGPYRARFLGL